MKQAPKERNVFEMIQKEYAEKELLMPEDVELVVANTRRKIRAAISKSLIVNLQSLPKIWRHTVLRTAPPALPLIREFKFC